MQAADKQLRQLAVPARHGLGPFSRLPPRFAQRRDDLPPSILTKTLAAEVAVPAAADFAAWERGTLRRLLVLDRIQDPGNSGTLFRTAAALDFTS